MELLLKARAKWRSDDERRNKEIYAAFDRVQKDHRELTFHIDQCITPLMVNLLEQTNL